MSTPLERTDVEERAMERAEENAQKRYGMSFDDLPAGQQMDLFMEAEQQVREELAEAAERAVDSRREYWDELELERRLGN